MIWCVDDDSTIREIELYALTQTGFEARGFEDGIEMLEALKKEKPSLIILDIMLPGKDGVEVLREIRRDPKNADIPIIMASAKGTEPDKIHTLDTGADDYLVKPFGVMEMVSRVKAVLRRCKSAEVPVLKIGSLTLDDKAHIVSVDGNEVKLTFKEYAMLKLFMSSPGTVFTRDELLSNVWGVDYFGETRTVDMHIKTLRQKLGVASSLIKTVIGVGYKLEA